MDPPDTPGDFQCAVCGAVGYPILLLAHLLPSAQGSVQVIGGGEAEGLGVGGKEGGRTEGQVGGGGEGGHQHKAVYMRTQDVNIGNLPAAPDTSYLPHPSQHEMPGLSVGGWVAGRRRGL